MHLFSGSKSRNAFYPVQGYHWAHKRENRIASTQTGLECRFSQVKKRFPMYIHPPSRHPHVESTDSLIKETSLQTLHRNDTKYLHQAFTDRMFVPVEFGGS